MGPKGEANRDTQTVGINSGRSKQLLELAWRAAELLSSFSPYRLSYPRVPAWLSIPG